MLSIRNVCKEFGDPEDDLAAVPAVDNVSIDVRQGEFFSIIGPSGCGKSTLLRIIGTSPHCSWAVVARIWFLRFFG